MVTIPLLCQQSSEHEKLSVLEETSWQPLEMLASRLHETLTRQQLCSIMSTCQDTLGYLCPLCEQHEAIMEYDQRSSV